MVTTVQDRQQTEIDLPGIVELVSRPAGTPSGLSRYAETLARHLDEAGLPFQECKTAMPRMLRPLARLAQVGGYDLATFFTNYPVSGTFSPNALHHLTSESLASLLLFQSLKPVVVTVHGFFTYLLRDDPELSVYPHIFHRWFDDLVVRGLRRADHLIAVSHYMRDVMVERIGIPAGKITVIHEAVDHDTFYPAPVADSLYQRFDLSPDHRHLLFVGSEQPRKNFLALIRTFARVHERMPDVRLLKVGRPEYEAERQKALDLIAALGLQDAVIFVGHLADELPDFYRLADLFVFPSLYEGFGFPPLEAMACGTPVICSNTTSLPEVVGDAALLFDPLDESRLVTLMEQVLAEAELAEELSQKGLERASSFMWEKTAAETIRLYSQFLSSSQADSVREDLI